MYIQKESRNYLVQLVNTIPDKEISVAQRFLEFLIEKSDLKEDQTMIETQPKTRKSIHAADLSGKFAHIPGGSEEFMKEKHEENEQEERKFQERTL
jgi:hypothetical protein